MNFGVAAFGSVLPKALLTHKNETSTQTTQPLQNGLVYPLEG